MSKRSRAPTDEAEDSYKDTMLTAPVSDLNDPTQGQNENSLEHASSHAATKSWKQIKSNRKATHRLADRVGDTLNIEEDPGKAAMIVDSVEVGPTELPCPETSQQNAGPTDPAIQSVTGYSTAHYPDPRTNTHEQLSNQLYHSLLSIADRHPESGPAINSVIEILASLHGRHIKDIKNHEVLVDDLMDRIVPLENGITSLKEKNDWLEEQVASQDDQIASKKNRIQKLKSLFYRQKDLTEEIHKFATNKIYHTEYDNKLLRSEIEMTKRDHEESKSGQTERELRSQISTLDARLVAMNGQLYGEGGLYDKTGKKKKK